MDAGEYCRAVESYLCRKNDGHLIRVVGPAFEMVCAWAATGVPLSVVRRGIDQRFARYYAKGPRRFPLRIEFCEADVLTLFDYWKRAVHVSGAGVREADTGSGPGAPDAGAEGEPTPRPGRRSLAAHLEHLTAALAEWAPPAGSAPPALAETIASARVIVDEARPTTGTIRGGARQALIERLGAFDRLLTAAARQDTDQATTARLRSEAADSLAPFRERMLPSAFASALDSATDHLLAEHWHLPRLTYQ